MRIRMSAGSRASKMLWIHYLVGVSHFAECVVKISRWLCKKCWASILQ